MDAPPRQPPNGAHHSASHRHRQSRRLLLSLTSWRQRLTFWCGAGVVGIAAVAFALAADQAQSLFHWGIDQWRYLPLVVTPTGLALSAWLAVRIFPGSQGSGIPQAIAARHLDDDGRRHALLSLRIMGGKIMLTLLGLACGASIGREGPTVQVGASIMLAAGAIAGLGRERGLILAGGAAGVAAAFNTPLAGVVFAIEELARGFDQRANGLVLSAIVIAGMASMLLLGNYTYFGHTTIAVRWADWPVIPIVGVAGGLAGGLFTRTVLGLGGWLSRRLAGRHWVWPVGVAAVAGAVTAVLGVVEGGEIYGTGYAQARMVLEHSGTLSWGYMPAKLLATAAATVAGIPGGLFAPSLSVGAGMGALLSALIPGMPLATLVTLSMVAYFAGVVQAPVTATVIVMEMTDGHASILPLMATAVIAFGLSRLVNSEPIYHAMAGRILNALPAASQAPAPGPT
ncbi:MAG: chloride channel protein [Azospirillaceae bacterium]|nr:chloride channel protein [Azospirillaceae bacterium]